MSTNANIIRERIFKGDMDYLEIWVSKGKSFAARDLVFALHYQNHNLDLVRLVSRNVDESLGTPYKKCLWYIGEIDVIRLFNFNDYRIPKNSMRFAASVYSVEFLEYVLDNKKGELSDIDLLNAVRGAVGIEKVAFIHSHLADFSVDEHSFMGYVIYGEDTEVWDYFYGDLEFGFQDLVCAAKSYYSFNVKFGLYPHKEERVKKFETVMGRVYENLDMSDEQFNLLYSMV